MELDRPFIGFRNIINEKEKLSCIKPIKPKAKEFQFPSTTVVSELQRLRFKRVSDNTSFNGPN